MVTKVRACAKNDHTFSVWNDCIPTYIRRQQSNQIRRYYPRDGSNSVDHRSGRPAVVGADVQGVDLHTTVVRPHEGHGEDEPEYGESCVAAGVGSQDDADTRTSRSWRMKLKFPFQKNNTIVCYTMKRKMVSWFSKVKSKRSNTNKVVWLFILTLFCENVYKHVIHFMFMS